MFQQEMSHSKGENSFWCKERNRFLRLSILRKTELLDVPCSSRRHDVRAVPEETCGRHGRWEARSKWSCKRPECIVVTLRIYCWQSERGVAWKACAWFFYTANSTHEQGSGPILFVRPSVTLWLRHIRALCSCVCTNAKPLYGTLSRASGYFRENKFCVPKRLCKPLRTQSGTPCLRSFVYLLAFFLLPAVRAPRALNAQNLKLRIKLIYIFILVVFLELLFSG